MNLLANRHERGRVLEARELVEEGDVVAVRLAVSDPELPEPVEVFKVFTFRADRVVEMRDCVDRDDALARLGRRLP